MKQREPEGESLLTDIEKARLKMAEAPHPKSAALTEDELSALPPDDQSRIRAAQARRARKAKRRAS